MSSRHFRRTSGWNVGDLETAVEPEEKLCVDEDGVGLEDSIVEVEELAVGGDEASGRRSGEVTDIETLCCPTAVDVSGTGSVRELMRVFPFAVLLSAAVLSSERSIIFSPNFSFQLAL